jgi:endonuclease III-like uncharacterized protein
MNQIIPQPFIDTVQLELDELLQSVKDRGIGNISVEQLALFLFDKKDLISDTEHRQILTVMVAILLKRVSSNG